MVATCVARGAIAMLMLLIFALPVRAQSFRVQCPFTTASHPDPTDSSHGGIKCQQISGGDWYASIGGVQTYLFSGRGFKRFETGEVR